MIAKANDKKVSGSSPSPGDSGSDEVRTKDAAETNGDPVTAAKDDLEFQGSETPTIGVEIEVPVLDKEDFQLVPGAPRILEACAADEVQGVSAELMQSMLEIRTDICADAKQAREQLFSRLFKARNIASSLGYELAMFGTHPFQRINASAITEDARYARIANKLGWITYHRVAFGLHVHVAVRDGDQAIALMNVCTRYLPHLLAMSANSPFWQGVDTGLASSRAVLYGLVAHSGVPPQFQNWKEFRDYCQLMMDCKALGSFKGIKWDIRPRPDFGTIEFRICDAPGSLDVMMGLVALIRTLVISTQRLLEESPRASRGDRRREWINSESRWLAARYGLEAPYIRTPRGKRGKLGQELAELVERLMPVARESGDHAYLMKLMPLTEFETGAERQRRLYREHGDWQALIRDSITRMTAALKPKSSAEPGRSSDSEAGGKASTTGVDEQKGAPAHV